MSKEVAEVLRKGLERLGPNGERWNQGSYILGDKVCASEAIGGPESIAYPFLYKIIGETVSVWNDTEGRTFAEVKAKFERAIALAEAN